MVLDTELALLPGSKVVLHYQQSWLPAYVLKLHSILHKSTQAILKTDPRCIPSNSLASVDIAFDSVICIEVFRSCKELGRILLRYSVQ